MHFLNKKRALCPGPGLGGDDDDVVIQSCFLLLRLSVRLSICPSLGKEGMGKNEKFLRKDP